jgi:DNA-binding SARP family transcriptional activator
MCRRCEATALSMFTQARAGDRKARTSRGSRLYGDLSSKLGSYVRILGLGLGGAGMAEGRRLVVGLLGPVEISVAGEWHGLAQRGLRILLARLASAPNRIVTASALIDAVWQEEPSRERRNNLNSHVYQLRQRLRQLAPPDEIPQIITQPPGYRIVLDTDQLDVTIFMSAAARGRRAAANGDPVQAGKLFREALSLWRGAALADVADYCPQLAAAAAGLDEQRLGVLEDRIESDMAAGRHDELVAELTTLVAAYPVRERFWGQLMLALYRCHRQADALGAYRQARAHLAKELGLDPGHALRTLHERILQADPELTAPTARAEKVVGSPHVPRQLPAVVRDFMGRRAELKRLGELLDQARPGGTVLITALGGAGGIGKTALALHWAHQVTGRFPDGQIYINLRGYDPAGEPVAAVDAIRELLDCLGVGAAPPGLDGQAALFRTLVADKRMVILLDNARDAGQVRPLLPASPGSVVIVTSRNSLHGLAASEGAIQIPLEVLGDDDAEALLRARLGAERLAREPGAVGQLLSRCAGLPLALSIVAARAAARPHTSLTVLAAAMADSTSLLDALETGDPAIGVRAVISWSYQQLSAPAARMFRLLGIHPGPDISVPAAASLAATSAAGARQSLDELTSVSLLTEPTTGRYAYHDLIRAYAAEQASREETAEQVSAAIRRCLDHYLHSSHAAQQHFRRWPPALALPEPEIGVTAEAPRTADDAMQWFASEIAVIYRCIVLAGSTGLHNHAWQITWTSRSYFFKSGQVTRNQVQALAEIITVAAAASQGDDLSLGAAHHMCSRAITGFALGGSDVQDGESAAADSRWLEQAAWHAGQALRYFTTAGDLAAQGWCHLQCGQIMFHQGDVAGAFLAAEEATRLMTTAGSDQGQAIALIYQGSWAHTLGQHEAGLTALERSAAMLRSLNGAELATAYRNIGEALWRERRYGAAEQSLRDGLAIYQEAGNVSGAVQTLSILGNVQAEAGNIETACATWQQALGLLGGGYHFAAADLRQKLESHARLKPTY